MGYSADITVITNGIIRVSTQLHLDYGVLVSVISFVERVLSDSVVFSQGAELLYLVQDSLNHWSWTPQGVSTTMDYYTNAVKGATFTLWRNIPLRMKSIIKRAKKYPSTGGGRASPTCRGPGKWNKDRRDRGGGGGASHMGADRRGSRYVPATR